MSSSEFYRYIKEKQRQMEMYGYSSSEIDSVLSQEVENYKRNHGTISSTIDDSPRWKTEYSAEFHPQADRIIPVSEKELASLRGEIANLKATMKEKDETIEHLNFEVKELMLRFPNGEENE